MSTAISWYEGSGIIDNPLEWKYSTPVSQIFNIEINNGQDISQLDYFVYAAKFQPFFPAIMIVSVLYICTVVIFFIFQLNHQLAIWRKRILLDYGCRCIHFCKYGDKFMVQKKIHV